MEVVPVRHPGRWVAGAVILVLSAMLVDTLLFSHVTRGGVREGRFQWGVVWRYLFDAPVLRGIGVTLELTLIAMVSRTTCISQPIRDFRRAMSACGAREA